MRSDKRARILSVVALVASLIALAMAMRNMAMQQEHRREMEALGEIIREASSAGRPILKMGPPGEGAPELDRGE